MKIKPTSTFITNQVAADGEAIILIGTRLAESQQRAKSIKKHDIKGHRLSKHPLNPNTYTYAPIKELMLEEVWWIINTVPSPWGFDNQILFKIYRLFLFLRRYGRIFSLRSLPAVLPKIFCSGECETS